LKYAAHVQSFWSAKGYPDPDHNLHRSCRSIQTRAVLGPFLCGAGTAVAEMLLRTCSFAAKFA